MFPKRLKVVLFMVLLLACASSALANTRELAKRVLDSTGIVDARLDMPWREWQNLSDEQRLEFEQNCQFNRELLEADLIDFLVTEFSDSELETILEFNESPTGRKWLAATGPKGGFNIPPLNEAATGWQNSRRSEARSYVTSLMLGQSWTSPFYKGIVGDRTTNPQSVYKGDHPLDVFGLGESEFIKVFGPPDERTASGSEEWPVLQLSGEWSGYLYEALLVKGKLSRIALTRLPDEGGNYVEKMRTQLSTGEIESLLAGFSKGMKWTEYESPSLNGKTYYLGESELFCFVSEFRILFDTSPSFGRSPGP